MNEYVDKDMNMVIGICIILVPAAICFIWQIVGEEIYSRRRSRLKDQLRAAGDTEGLARLELAEKMAPTSFLE